MSDEQAWKSGGSEVGGEVELLEGIKREKLHFLKIESGGKE